jgi:hypothetical protein
MYPDNNRRTALACPDEGVRAYVIPEEGTAIVKLL